MLVNVVMAILLENFSKAAQAQAHPPPPVPTIAKLARESFVIQLASSRLPPSAGRPPTLGRIAADLARYVGRRDLNRAIDSIFMRIAELGRSRGPEEPGTGTATEGAAAIADGSFLWSGTARAVAGGSFRRFLSDFVGTARGVKGGSTGEPQRLVLLFEEVRTGLALLGYVPPVIFGPDDWAYLVLFPGLAEPLLPRGSRDSSDLQGQVGLGQEGFRQMMLDEVRELALRGVDELRGDGDSPFGWASDSVRAAALGLKEALCEDLDRLASGDSTRIRSNNGSGGGGGGRRRPELLSRLRLRVGEAKARLDGLTAEGSGGGKKGSGLVVRDAVPCTESVLGNPRPRVSDRAAARAQAPTGATQPPRNPPPAGMEPYPPSRGVGSHRDSPAAGALTRRGNPVPLSGRNGSKPASLPPPLAAFLPEWAWWASPAAAAAAAAVKKPSPPAPTASPASWLGRSGPWAWDVPGSGGVAAGASPPASSDASGALTARTPGAAGMRGGLGGWGIGLMGSSRGGGGGGGQGGRGEGDVLSGWLGGLTAVGDNLFRRAPAAGGAPSPGGARLFGSPLGAASPAPRPEEPEQTLRRPAGAP